MYFKPSISIPALLVVALLLTSASPAYAAGGNLRNRKLVQASTEECTLLVVSELRIDAPSGAADEFFECQMDPDDMGGVSSLSLPIKANNGMQKKILKALLASGELVSGESTLKLGQGNVGIDAEGLHLPNGFDVALGKKPKRRNLAVVTGVKPILVVKVIDSGGLARPESPAIIGDNIFGTIDDPVNLASQMKACSFGQLDIVPGPQTGGLIQDAPGVITITIPVSLLDNSRSNIRNAVTTAAQVKLGFNLPGPYQQVMYVLENCYVDCGWAAYAYVNSWNSVYQGNYYYMTGVLMHELGHNFNLAHSGGLDGQTYTDHTGLMGNPLYSDDVGKMCFNGAKTWQIGWYDNNKMVLNPREDSSTTLTLVGIADFQNNPDNHPVVVKIETQTVTDHFIAFNRAIGVNSQNDEADNEVTIVQSGNNGEGYSQSYLKATLTQDEIYIFTNWQGTGQDLTVEATVINLSANPAYATVQVCLGACPPEAACTTNVECDDGLFCNGAETCNAGACIPGSPPVCSDGLFCNGLETCNESAGGCVDGLAPECNNDGNGCNGLEQCNEAAGACIQTDAIDCSSEFSFCGKQKVCDPITSACVDDGSGEDGTCDSGTGETCALCAGDCSSTYPGAVCGNGICEDTENCSNCDDCNSKTNGNSNTQYCCSGGPDGTCGDARCTVVDGNTCNANSGAAVLETCCGDGECQGSESASTCPLDCSPPPPSCDICRWTGEECCGSCSNSNKACV